MAKSQCLSNSLNSLCIRIAARFCLIEGVILSPVLWKAAYFILKQPDFNYYWIFCGISEQRNKLVLRSLNILISPRCQSYLPEDSVLYNYNRNICAAWKVSVFGVILVCIQSECGKIRTRITLNTDTFYAALDNAVPVAHLKGIILP